jgi:hypothetical protein
LELTTTRRISGYAYQSLRDALAVIVWRKPKLKSYLHYALRENPELLAGIDFEGLTKREAVDILTDRLVKHERQYQDVTLRLMVEVADMTRFPDLEIQADKPHLIGQAEEAVADLKDQVAAYRQNIESREKSAERIQGYRDEDEKRRDFAADIEACKVEFYRLARDLGSEPQRRGIEFERFLSRVFDMWDLAPRLSYNLENEQVDGAFTFDTDDYVLEAKWTREKFSRGQADTFAGVVRRKGKNALGIVVSMAGFSPEMLRTFDRQTSFMTMDGPDLLAVLNRWISLTDLLAAKKRHANETGSCHYPVSDILG